MDRSFDLGEQYEAIIDDAVKTGRYTTPDEVVRESLRLLIQREAAIARFDAEIQKGIEAADRGELIDAEEVLDRLERKYRDMAEQRRRRA